MKKRLHRQRFGNLLITFYIFSSFIFTSCIGTSYQLTQAKNTEKIEFEATISPAIQFQQDENQYLFDGHIINRGKKDLFLVEAVLYLKDGKRRIQEKGPIILYEKDKPLRPGYEATFTQIIRLPVTSWDGKDYEVEITKTK